MGNFRELAAARLRREEGAEAVEFALVGPLLFFLVFGLIYLLLLFAAQVSLGWATNVGVRYAAIGEPGVSEVIQHATDRTPFFSPERCNAQLASSGTNLPVTLTMNCDFPNPAGAAVDALRSALFGGGDELGSVVELSATAQSRKE